MTIDSAVSPAPPPVAQLEPGLPALRSSRELQLVPADRAPAPPAAAPAPSAVSPPLANARPPAAAAPSLPLHRRIIAAPPPELTWGLASVALAATVGWIYERRRRRLLQIDADSALWPSERSPPLLQAPRTSTSSMETFPSTRNSRDPGASVHSVYASVIGDSTSRREATLVDLHQLHFTLARLRERQEIAAAADLLEEHLLDFRYTSPWVFLELRELYRHLDRPREWDMAREVFRTRFGQNAPQWGSPSSADKELADDAQLCQELQRKWPQREARLFMLRWMLGDALSRQKNSGPPQLPLGIYRDMMLLDNVLDEVLSARATVPPRISAAQAG